MKNCNNAVSSDFKKDFATNARDGATAFKNWLDKASFKDTDNYEDSTIYIDMVLCYLIKFNHVLVLKLLLENLELFCTALRDVRMEQKTFTPVQRAGLRFR